jgi:hypothetical protein
MLQFLIGTAAQEECCDEGARPTARILLCVAME